MTEYYRFHHEVPRIFWLTIRLIMEKFWNRKRKYEYYRVKSILKETGPAKKDKNHEEPVKYSMILKEIICENFE